MTQGIITTPRIKTPLVVVEDRMSLLSFSVRSAGSQVCLLSDVSRVSYITIVAHPALTACGTLSIGMHSIVS